MTQPTTPDPFARAFALHRANKLDEAEPLYREVLAANPNHADATNLLGTIAYQRGHHAQALELIRKAISMRANVAPYYNNLAAVYIALNRFDEAAKSAQSALTLQPNLAPALVNYGESLTQLGRERDALHVYMRGAQQAPDNPIFKIKIGEALLRLWEVREAGKWFSSVLEKDPNSAAALCGLGDVYREGHRPQEAVTLYEKSLRRVPSLMAYRGLADAYRDSNQADKAEATWQKALELFPNRPEAHLQRGVSLAHNGKMDAAAEEFRAALRLQPHYPKAFAELARLLKGKLPADEQAAMESALKLPATDDDMAGMHFALAQVEDARDDFARAAEHLRRANALAKSYLDTHGREYNASGMGVRVDMLVATYSADYFQRTTGFGDPSERPVFVVGMPRSGTTLVEQILASHPKIFGAGELQYVHHSFLRVLRTLGLGDEVKGTIDELKHLEKLTQPIARDCAKWYLEQIRQLDGGVAERVVDKAPENYLLLGWIATIFPKAKIIHCRRDLRDVALSCWMTEFRAGTWSNDMRHLASRIRDYRRLMDYWNKALPIPMLEMNYEQLVANQEVESRKLIEFVGLDWDPACLNFHQTRRAVLTPSATQVRQPMYARSIGRWRHYIDDLRPLIEELGLRLS